jgi:menaquinone-specific isochorismate synthase
VNAARQPEPGGSREPRSAAWLDAGLALAARAPGLVFIALPVPVASAAAVAAAWCAEPLVAWTAGELSLVGVGVARELRGTGEARWVQIVAGARALPVGGAVIAGEPAPIGALGLARPRFVGGAAFAPGAADRAPWLGFGDAWFALPRWTYVHDGARAHLVLAVDAADAADAARWHAELARHQAAFAAAVPRAQPPIVELSRAGAAEWRAQIEAITQAIAGGACAKVVAARTCTVALAAPARAAELLAALGDRHAECIRVLVRPPGAGTLVAATPERLVRRDGDTVRCDALAGTISATHEAGAAALLASGKDRWEHDLVVRAIREALEDAGAIVEAPAEPAVRTLRHVLHLCTPFRATLRAPRHVLELAARLHPTPAVGGTPTAVAVDWITRREPAPRGWYASPVGWFDLDGNGELAVAIRSGVLAGNRAHLWTGAGIVAGSDPERELAETESKLRAMLDALGGPAPRIDAR